MHFNHICSEILDDSVLEQTGDSQWDVTDYVPIASIGNEHQISFIPLHHSGVSLHQLQCMQHGTTVTCWNPASGGRPIDVLLRVEGDVRMLSWTRPPWDSVGGVYSPTLNRSFDGKTVLQPPSSAVMSFYQSGLRYKLDECDDGYLDLTTVREVTLGSATRSPVTGSFEDVELTARMLLTLSFGVGSIVEHRTIEFCMTDSLVHLWYGGLRKLVRSAQQMARRYADRRVHWLKQQYLQLYYDAGGEIGVGCTPTEAIRVWETCNFT